jgi:undecaprenyl-diphosphatase
MQITIFHAIVLGFVQGITEFLPVSSSGHLILIPEVLGWHLQSLAFDTILHMGTVGALILYFWRDLLALLENKKYLGLIIVGSIPAGFLGFFFGDALENAFRSAFWVAAFLLLGSLIMLLAEVTYKKVWFKERKDDPSLLSYKDATVIGVFQSLALLSGISRSGATISGGMFSKLTRETAARFSFILSIPIVIGAGLFKIVDSYQDLSFNIVMLAGFLTSLITGMLAIKYFLKFLKSNNLYLFIVYRILLACLVLALLT